MPKVALYDMAGTQKGEIELSEAVFGVAMNEPVVHQVVVAQLANKRQGTQSALTRAEVRGGGRKPWRQKGTGRARQGSTRSPQWRHGGIVFAPKPRDYSKAVPRKVRRLAMKCALSAKVSDNEIIVLDQIALSQPKTREIASMLKNLKADKKALIVIPERDEAVLRATGNIQGVKVAYVNTLNVYDILTHDAFIVAQGAIAQIEEVYAG